MGTHQKVDVSALRTDVLEEVKNTLRLTRCPKCGNGMDSDICSLGVEIQRPDNDSFGDTQSKWKTCPACQLVWQLKLCNWTNERGDGMVTGEGYLLSLYAFSNCYCRSSLLYTGEVWDRRHGLIIEDSKRGHRRLPF